jgi:flagellar motor switch/type III secretory pathway protein FliN
MASADTLAQAFVEMTAVLSTTSVASGRLAILDAGDTIEITPDVIAGPLVALKTGGKTIARARLRRADDRLIATIIEVGDTSELPLDEWRFSKKSSPAIPGPARSDV